MSSKRTILSRPRTRVYDANYNIGESMYRPALDRLNRKYTGRPLSPPKRLTKVPADILERHDRAFFDDDLDNCRRRAEKHIAGESFYDSRGARLDARELMDSGFDDETVTRIRSVRASKKVSLIDDVDMDDTLSNANTRRILDRSEKILDSVGYNNEINGRRKVDDDFAVVSRRAIRDERRGSDEDFAGLSRRAIKNEVRKGFDEDFASSRRAIKDSARRGFDEDVTVKRRSLRITQDEEGGSREASSKWSSLREDDSGATFRAKQSKARLDDLEDEMEAMAERQAEREKKAARLRALIAEVAEENDIPVPVSTTRRAVRIKEEQEELTC